MKLESYLRKIALSSVSRFDFVVWQPLSWKLEASFDSLKIKLFQGLLCSFILNDVGYGELIRGGNDPKEKTR